MRFFLLITALLLLYSTLAHDTTVSSDGETDDIGRGLNEAVPDWEELLAQAQGNFDWMQTFRRKLHTHPELMYQEHWTSQQIQDELEKLNIPFTTGWGKNIHQDIIPGEGGTGIVATIGSGEPPCVALRADIDALPILEKTTLEFRSEQEGKMHACGHDGHTTMLLGAAKVLKEHEPALNGTIKLLFQPAEEGGAGAKRMIEEGVLESYPPIQRMFGFHVAPFLPSGIVAGRPGPIMASSDFFKIEVRGIGGHGAMPHLTIDPMIPSASIVMNLQAIVSRRIDPLASGVVSVTMFSSSSNAHNVISDSVSIGGTYRALSVEKMEFIKKSIIQIATNIAEAHDCEISFDFMRDPYPTVMNHPDLWQFARRIAGQASTNGTLLEVDPLMGGEDFAFFGHHVPSLFLFLGQGSGKEDFHQDHPSVPLDDINSDEDTSFGLHNPRFNLHEPMMVKGAALHSHLALQSLKDLARS